jgi:ribosomal protein L37AE/L43A
VSTAVLPSDRVARFTSVSTQKWRNVSCSVVDNQVVSRVSVGVWKKRHADEDFFGHRVVWWVLTDVSEKHVATGSFVAREAS